jgi:hypothetical protein
MGIMCLIGVVFLNLILINCNVKNNWLSKYWLIEETNTGLFFGTDDSCQIYKKYISGKEGMPIKTHFVHNGNTITIDSILYNIKVINQEKIVLANRQNTITLIKDKDQKTKIDYKNRFDILTK